MLVLWGTMLAVVANAFESASVMPGAVALWQEGETIPVPGVSLKVIDTTRSDRLMGWTDFEVRAFRGVRDGESQADLSWPGIFGFLYPGISLEFRGGDVVPVVYGEVDLFYFPFLLATLIVTERPWFIPSVYMGPRFAPDRVGWNTGIRISIPVPPGGGFDD